MDDSARFLPSIGIITALAREYAAVKALLVDTHEEQRPGEGAGRRYVHGYILTQPGDRRAVVLTLADKGNNIAATRATRMLAHYESVKVIIMTGIAGGVPFPERPADHVRLGDIVVSDKKGVIQYDFRKEEYGSEEIRSASIPPSAELLEAARLLQAGELEGLRPWERHIEAVLKKLKWKRPRQKSDVLMDTKDPTAELQHPRDSMRRGFHPRVFVGPIAASNTLLKNPEHRDALRDQFGVKAVEMEGSGVADATWDHERGYLVVRSVCDYCDARKGDDWQDYAAAVAAAYTFALIESLPAITIAGGDTLVDGPIATAPLPNTWPPPLVHHSPDLANRSGEFSFFMAMLQADVRQRGLFFEGESNHGKTSLVRECVIYSRTILASQVCAIVDFKTNSTKEYVLDTLRFDLRQLLPRFSAPGSAPVDLREDLHALSTPAVLFFDAYEKASTEARELIEGLLLADLARLPWVRVVIAGQKVPDHRKALWAQDVKYFLLGPIKDAVHWKTYGEQRYGPLNTAYVEGLTIATKGVPGVLSPMLQTLAAENEGQM